MPHQEALREALLELDRLRAREAAARRESEALLAALDGMTRAGDGSEALDALLESMRGAFGADATAVAALDGARAAVRRASDPAIGGVVWPDGAALLRAPRRLVDIRAAAIRAEPPGAVARFQSMIAAPAPGGVVILCLSEARARFTAADLRLLQRMAALAGQALAVQALQERNALLAAVIDGTSTSVAIADARDPATPLVYVNPAFERLTGYAAAETLGHNCRFLSAEPPDSVERSRLRAAVAAREAGAFELRNRRRDGTTFLNRLTLYPIFGRDGEATHLVAAQTDVTDTRAAETDRDAARRRLAQALSSTAQGMLVADAAGRVVFANPAWRSFFPAPESGWTEGADIARVWAAGLAAQGAAPDAALAAARARRDALFAGGPAREETAVDGRVALVEDHPTPDGGAVSVATDVTSLKAVERMLGDRVAAIEAAAAGIAITDARERFTFANAAMAAMFGFASATDMLGRPWRGLYAPEEAARLSALTDAALSAQGVWRGEAAGRRRDGEAVEIDMSLSRLPSGGLVCITRDVSAQKREARERARLRDQLQAAQRQEAAGQLAAGLAHDFNNILAVIAGSAALLRDDLPAGDPRQAQVGRIAGAAGAAAGLVARLMALAARRTTRARIDLRGPVRDAVDLASAGLPAGVEIESGLPDAPLFADADPTEVMQVALNLAINARDALRGLGGRIRVSLASATAEQRAGPCAVGTAAPDMAYAALCVEDDGIGMDPDEAAQAFRPYFSTKGADGTGLGLSVLAGIVTAAGGAVRLDTAVGEGARFTVLWPLAAVGAAPTPRPAAGPARLDGLAVLVVDDAAPVLQTLAEILERAGAEVGACEDPADALEAIAEDPEAWALLVTDYDMPDMTGAELARAARAVAPFLPVVLCTALPDRLAAGRDEFDAVVGKPVTPEALLEAAGAALARRAGPRHVTEDACGS